MYVCNVFNVQIYLCDVCVDDVYYDCLHVYIFFNICIDKYEKAKTKSKELKFIFNLCIWHLFGTLCTLTLFNAV